MIAKLIVAMGFLATNLYTYHWLAQDAVFPDRETFEQFPLALGEWTCPRQELIDAKTLKNLGATDYIICNYVNQQRSEGANFYVGYHETQIREEGGGAGENSIHPPAHCLPGAGWDIIASDTVRLDLPGFPVSAPRVKRIVVAKGEQRQLVYYWYQSRGRVIAEDWQKILFVGWDRATRQRTDGSLVRFMVPIVRGDEERAEQVFLELARMISPELPRFAPN